MYDLTPLTTAIRILLAVACGSIIGAERLMSGRAAGIRTHVLVCVGSALTMLVGIYAAQALGLSTDPLRIAAQVISGIGFLGVGTILIKGRNEVTGLTTAAGLWTTAAIGLALGIGCYSLAILVTAITFLTILVVTRLEKYLKKRKRGFELYLELEDVSYVNEVLDYLKNVYSIDEVDVTAPRSAVNGNVGMEIVLSVKTGTYANEIKNQIQKVDHVVYVLESI